MTPAQLRAKYAFESRQKIVKESKNNPPCVTCGDKIRTKIGNQCFKCKHYRNQ